MVQVSADTDAERRTSRTPTPDLRHERGTRATTCSCDRPGPRSDRRGQRQLAEIQPDPLGDSVLEVSRQPRREPACHPRPATAALPAGRTRQAPVESRRDNYADQLDQLRLASEVSTGGARGRLARGRPDSPVRPMIVRNVLLAFILGLVLAIGVASPRLRRPLRWRTSNGVSAACRLGLVPLLTDWRDREARFSSPCRSHPRRGLPHATASLHVDWARSIGSAYADHERRPRPRARPRRWQPGRARTAARRASLDCDLGGRCTSLR